MPYYGRLATRQLPLPCHRCQSRHLDVCGFHSSGSRPLEMPPLHSLDCQGQRHPCGSTAWRYWSKRCWHPLDARCQERRWGGGRQAASPRERLQWGDNRRAPGVEPPVGWSIWRTGVAKWKGTLLNEEGLSKEGWPNEHWHEHIVFMKWKRGQN